MTKSRGINRRNPFDRLMERTELDPATGCLIWPGSVNRGGYGQIYDHRIRRYVAIHRLAYQEVNGVIPEGLTIDHLCRNTRCANPQHLEAVSIQENIRRKPRPDYCKRGHELAGANVYEWGGRRHCRTCAVVRYQARAGRRIPRDLGVRSPAVIPALRPILGMARPVQPQRIERRHARRVVADGSRSHEHDRKHRAARLSANEQRRCWTGDELRGAGGARLR